MTPHRVIRYGFKIRTRSGVVVENLSIQASDADEARRKLGQMYNDCEILESHCQVVSLGTRSVGFNYEDVVEMIVSG